MFGWKKPVPEIKFYHHNDIFLKVVVTVGKESITRYISLTNAFPKAILRPPPAVPTITVNHWHVLGCLPTKDPKVIQTAFRKMSMIYHPDQGGSKEAFATLTRARDSALAQCK